MEGYDLAFLRESLGERLFYSEELGSTNEEALRKGREGALAGSVFLAQRQIAGRGRRGATWFCAEDAGLAFTLLLRPSFERALWPRLSLVAGLAVAQSIESTGLFPEIKWPNDVLISGRKVCGILVEAEGDFVAVGIGLNVGKAILPDELRDRASSLAEEGGQGATREEHLLMITERMASLQNRIVGDFSSVLVEVRARCGLAGKEIEFLEGQNKRSGICEGIGEGGDLLVREEGRLKRYLTADEIRVMT